VNRTAQTATKSKDPPSVTTPDRRPHPRTACQGQSRSFLAITGRTSRTSRRQRLASLSTWRRQRDPSDLSPHHRRSKLPKSHHLPSQSIGVGLRSPQRATSVYSSSGLVCQRRHSKRLQLCTGCELRVAGFRWQRFQLCCPFSSSPHLRASPCSLLRRMVGDPPARASKLRNGVAAQKHLEARSTLSTSHDDPVCRQLVLFHFSIRCISLLACAFPAPRSLFVRGFGPPSLPSFPHIAGADV
jgi:hypothetical protein